MDWQAGRIEPMPEIVQYILAAEQGVGTVRELMEWEDGPAIVAWAGVIREARHQKQERDQASKQT